MPSPTVILCWLLMLLTGAARAAPAAELWAFWDTSDERNARNVDHSRWQALLDGYLVTKDDGRTLFRYHAVSKRDRESLDQYVSSLAGTDPRTLARAEQLAFWINLYNALTVRVVLDHPAAKSIRNMGSGWFSLGPWNDKLVTIAGQAVSLNDIEHRILRPIWRDHRIHYAVNCASLGCPNLAPRAYTRSNARRLMLEGESHYLHHPRGLEFDTEGVLHLSSLFDWYQGDFGASRDAMLDYLASIRPDLAARLSGYQGRIVYHYDWRLNEAEASEPEQGK